MYGVWEVGNISESHLPEIAALLLINADRIGGEWCDTARERVR
jgi:hypothetical protein